ncbi:TrkH family potassium uptake protein [Flexivirga oryzae]|uniref:Trk-type K+ transport system membrane component n=1 Tax=Flexivirga oryzae TaxID=1794944 RepID=A0A839NBD4_9MICO|nr:potassium transporter TrkG [Flexivirga oryzae]MBB2894527.1 Trk-type K+ transport system membrane component [Flexivirga oryzae]
MRARFGPARIVVGFYAITVSAGTALLALPISSTHHGHAEFSTALFTAASATCITGMSPVDVATYWTPFGHVVMLLLVQAGGLGIVTLSARLLQLVRGRIGIEGTLAAQADAHTDTPAHARSMIRVIVRFYLMLEATLAVLLALRLHFAYGEGIGRAAWEGLFNSISAINNAGFTLYSEGAVKFAGDPWVLALLCCGVFIGGLGYPVWFELMRRRRPHQWSMHTRLTLYGSVILFFAGLVTFLVFEWRNPATLAHMGVTDKIWNSVGGAVFPRTAGFNTVDYAQVRPETMAVNYVLMFIGGGSAGTSGGIKVSTFFLLGAVIISEIRGEPQARVGPRAIPAAVQRQALTVALLGVGCVMAGMIAVITISEQPMQLVLFETISAFSTTGLSANLTSQLPVAAQIVLIALMFIGRVGTMTVGTALAMRRNKRRYRLPEEWPIVG